MADSSAKKLGLEMPSTSISSSGSTFRTVSVPNKFGVLRVEEPNIMETETVSVPSAASINKPPQAIKIPPIIVTSTIKDCGKFYSSLYKTIKNFRVQYNSKNTRILCNTNEDFQKVIDELSLANLEFYTYTPKADCQIKIVMKAAPHLSEDSILQNLKNKNINIENVNKLNSNKPNTQSKSFFTLMPRLPLFQKSETSKKWTTLKSNGNHIIKRISSRSITTVRCMDTAPETAIGTPHASSAQDLIFPENAPAGKRQLLQLVQTAKYRMLQITNNVLYT